MSWSTEHNLILNPPYSFFGSELNIFQLSSNNKDRQSIHPNRNGEINVGLWKTHILIPMKMAKDTRWSLNQTIGACLVKVMVILQQTMWTFNCLRL